MDKLTAIKIKYNDGTYSDEIPISVLSKNVEWDSTHTLVDVLGSIAFDTKGSVQDQLTQLFNQKLDLTDLSNYVNSALKSEVTGWLNQNVNPVGSAVVVDSSLTISGAAADAKKTGDEITALKADLTNSIEDTVGLIRYNLFKNVLYYKNLNGVQRGVAKSGCTVTTDGNTITLTATDTTVRLGSAGASNSNFNNYGFGYPISCVGASKLRFILSDGFDRNYVTFWDSTGGFILLSSIQTSNDFTLEVP